MKCPSCGQDNVEGARFCNQCGSALAPTQPTAAYSSPAGAGWQPSSPTAVAAPPTAIHGGSSRTVSPPAVSDDRHIVGQVSGLQRGSETNNWGTQIVWSFKVERFDSSGNRLQPIPVEMRAKNIPGVLNEGDWVRIPGQWKPGDTLHPQGLHNLTTNGLVGKASHGLVGKASHSVGRTLGILLALLMTALIEVAVVPFLPFTVPVLTIALMGFPLPRVGGPNVVITLVSQALLVASWVWWIRRGSGHGQFLPGLGTLLAVLFTLLVQLALVWVLASAWEYRSPRGQVNLSWLWVFVVLETLIVLFWAWRIRWARHRKQERS